MGRRVLHVRAGGLEPIAEQRRHSPSIVPLTGTKMGPKGVKMGPKWGQKLPHPHPTGLCPVQGRASSPPASATSAWREQAFLASLWTGLSAIFSFTEVFFMLELKFSAGQT